MWCVRPRIPPFAKTAKNGHPQYLDAQENVGKDEGQATRRYSGVGDLAIVRLRIIKQRFKIESRAANRTKSEGSREILIERSGASVLALSFAHHDYEIGSFVDEVASKM